MGVKTTLKRGHKVGILKTITKPKTTAMYHMHTCESNNYMHVIHSAGGFRFGDGLEYTYPRPRKSQPKNHHVGQNQEFDCSHKVGRGFILVSHSQPPRN